MAKALFLPGADRTSQWFGNKYDGTIFGDLDKVLLHSTETTGWPGYGGGGSAPTLTVNPWTKRARQHFNLNESARALLNPSTTAVSENKDKVCQIEVIGYSDKSLGVPRGMYLPNLPDDGMQWLAGIVTFIMREWTVPNVWATPFPWPLYPASYGTRTSSRMSSAEYDRFAGVLGHLHASGNNHGDPSLDVVDLRARVTKLLAPTPTPTPTKETPVAQYLVRREGQNAVWLSDLITRRWVEDPEDLAGIVAERKALGLAVVPAVKQTLKSYGVPVGEMPPEGDGVARAAS